MKRKEKKYYSRAEIAKILKIKPTLVSRWAKEFKIISKIKRGAKKAYTESDLKKLRIIKYLICQEGYKMKGAKSRLRKVLRSKKERFKRTMSRKFLLFLKKELTDLKKILEGIATHLL